ncbi:protein of unknown function [Ralstonia solanacearum CMR15]|nr:protein of unknown function [Ralstonia solanacearum CMR15]
MGDNYDSRTLDAVTTTLDINELERLAREATPQDFDSGEIMSNAGEWIDCPHCGGEGAVQLEADYCNYDGQALGVQFYGIGSAHGAAENYYRAARPAVVIAMIARIRDLEAAQQQAEPGADEHGALPTPFITTEVEGSPDPAKQRFRMVCHYRSIEDMHRGHDFFVAALKAAQQQAEPCDPTGLIARLRSHAEDRANTAFARSSMREAAGVLEDKQQAEHCQCAACKNGVLHASDCAVHNGPALPVGQCDCGKQQVEPSEQMRQMALADLYEFQQLTGCDSPAEYKAKLEAQQAEPGADERNVLQEIIDMGRASQPKHRGGNGENTVYLTPARYTALERAAQSGQRAGVAEDAARYRWLRAAWLADPDEGEDVAWTPIMYCADETEMDSAIDAAMAAAPTQQENRE